MATGKEGEHSHFGCKMRACTVVTKIRPWVFYRPTALFVALAMIVSEGKIRA